MVRSFDGELLMFPTIRKALAVALFIPLPLTVILLAH